MPPSNGAGSQYIMRLVGKFISYLFKIRSVSVSLNISTLLRLHNHRYDKLAPETGEAPNRGPRCVQDSLVSFPWPPVGEAQHKG